jgi:hypothetical protein
MAQGVSCANAGFQGRFRMQQIGDKRAAPNSFRRRDVILMLSIAGLIAIGKPPAIAAEDTIVNQESRQFDFWLGDWAIANPSGSTDATSRVYLALGQYLLVESWDDGKGHKGENLFAYSSDDKSWHGMFADNQGRVHVFTGKVTQGLAEFYGPSRGPKGEAILNRIRVVRIAADKVEQSWDQSADNGASWKAVFKGEYSKR